MCGSISTNIQVRYCTKPSSQPVVAHKEDGNVCAFITMDTILSGTSSLFSSMTVFTWLRPTGSTFGNI